MGRSRTFDGPPTVGALSGFPEGVSNDIDEAVRKATGGTDYLFPYNHFTNHPFKGVLEGTDFPGFSPEDANALLSLGMPKNVKQTTELAMDTRIESGGIVNIPFVERQADAAEMRSTFWIMELDETDDKGEAKLVLAYTQFIFLDFFGRFDGCPGQIRWPHISINMMEKIGGPGDEKAMDQAMYSYRRN